MGLRDSKLIHSAARVASLLRARNLAQQMGAAAWYIEREIHTAKGAYEAQAGRELPSDLRHNRELQAQLTEPLHQRILVALTEEAGPADKKRLDSLRCPHATSWMAAMG